VESGSRRDISFPQGKYGLTSMEMNVLELIKRGLKRKEIADRMNMSFHTVKTHLENAHRKLGVHNVAEAVAKLFHEHLFNDENTME